MIRKRMVYYLAALAVLLVFLSNFLILLERKEILFVTVPYFGLCVVISLVIVLILLIMKKWLYCIILFVFSIFGYCCCLYLGMSGDIAIERPIQNSNNYTLRAERYRYMVFEQHLFHKTIIAQKTSNVFYSDRTKIGLVLFFDSKLVRENNQSMVIDLSVSHLHIRDTLAKR
ncbi:MAG: hypothetical protein ACK5MZ_04570 [Aestuariibaculum sp.]